MTAAELATRWSAKRNGRGWIARCPAHDDQTASASFTDGAKGVLIRCHAGCATEDIVAKLGLTMADLFNETPSRTAKPRRKIVQAYDYEDETEALLYQCVRYDEPKDFRQRRPDAKEGWVWNMTGVRRVLYRLPDLRRRLADPDPEYRRQHGLPDDVFIPEGEKDVDRLLMRGLIATTNLGGAGKWSDEYTKQLIAAGAKSIVVIADNDTPGRRHAADVARSCHAAGLPVKVVDLPDVPEKGDVSDFLRQAGANRLKVLLQLAATALEYSEAAAPTGAHVASDDAANVRGRKVADAWPAPLRAVAYVGVLGDLVRAIEPHTEADPAALLLQTAAMFGNVIGRTAHFSVEGDRHHLNFFVALVGDTAKGRKGTSEGRARAPFREVDEPWAAGRIVEGLSSGEGLIYQVRDAIEKLQPVKEAGRVVDYQTVIEDPGIKDKRLLVIESELASTLRVMAREGNTLSPVIRRAWDGHDLQVLTKNSPARATAPHISIVGHITSDELRRYLDRTEAGNGFANRFLFCCVSRSKLLPDGGGNPTLMTILPRLRAAVEHAKRLGEIHRDPGARELWHRVYPALSSGRPGLLGAVTARAEAQVMRLAALFAVGDMSSVVTAQHLTAALEVWRYCFASARYVFGAAVGDPVADEIVVALRRTADGLTRSDILHRVFGRNRSAQDIGRALTMLEDAGLAYHQVDQDTGGRPAERWFAKEPDDINDSNDLTRDAHPHGDRSYVVNVVNVVGGLVGAEGVGHADLF